jgi:hypothetical protein
MSDQRPVNLTPTGPPETVLPPFDADAESRLAAAHSLLPQERKAVLSQLVADHPRFLAGWAALGDTLAETGDHPIARYAAYRVGYHRGLDTLRANGWRGSGYVRWSEPTNRGFLRALAGLGELAAVIGEDDESERCRQFLVQLDPTWSRDR